MDKWRAKDLQGWKKIESKIFAVVIRHDDYFENRYRDDGLIYIKLYREFVRIVEIEGSNDRKAI